MDLCKKHLVAVTASGEFVADEDKQLLQGRGSYGLLQKLERLGRRLLTRRGGTLPQLGFGIGNKGNMQRQGFTSWWIISRNAAIGVEEACGRSRVWQDQRSFTFT